jgi:hypothetical protein
VRNVWHSICNQHLRKLRFLLAWYLQAKTTQAALASSSNSVYDTSMTNKANTSSVSKVSFPEFLCQNTLEEYLYQDPEFPNNVNIKLNWIFFSPKEDKSFRISKNKIKLNSSEGYILISEKKIKVSIRYKDYYFKVKEDKKIKFNSVMEFLLNNDFEVYTIEMIISCLFQNFFEEKLSF